MTLSRTTRFLLIAAPAALMVAGTLAAAPAAAPSPQAAIAAVFIRA